MNDPCQNRDATRPNMGHQQKKTVETSQQRYRERSGSVIECLTRAEGLQVGA